MRNKHYVEVISVPEMHSYDTTVGKCTLHKMLYLVTKRRWYWKDKVVTIYDDPVVALDYCNNLNKGIL